MQSQFLIELGRWIERQRATEKRVDELHSDIKDIQATLKRFSLLALLWGSGLALSLSNKEAAEAIVTLVKVWRGQ